MPRRKVGLRRHGMARPPLSCSAPESEWLVVDYMVNRSAFNGYRQTPSAYSAVRCLRCGSVWRTKAAYVSRLNHEKGSP